MYKAFISYSQTTDARLAAALQSSLHRFGKPFYRLRAMHVFRDRTGLALTPELWPAIRKAIETSEHFIFLASPAAAASPWVGEELREWLRLHDDTPAAIFIVLTQGEIVWDRDQGDFDWTRTDALPPLLGGRFEHEPFFLDLRWARDRGDLGRRNARWQDDVGTLAAGLLGSPKDALIGEDRRQWRLARRLAFSATALVLALAIAASLQYLAARRQARTALANQLSAQATDLVDDPTLSNLLAIESLRVMRSDVAERHLHRSAAQLARRVSSIRHGEKVTRVRFVPNDDLLLLSAGMDGSARVWQRSDGHEIQRRRFANAVIHSAASPDGRLLAASGYEDKIAVWRLSDGETVLEHPDQYADVAFAPAGRWLAVVGEATEIWEVSAYGTLREAGRKDWGEPSLRSPRAIAFSRDGRRLAIGGTNPDVIVAEVPNLALATRCTHNDWAVDVALNADGTLLAAAVDDNTARVWRIPGCEEVLRIDHRSGVSAVALSPDETMLATASHDGEAKVVRIADGQPVASVRHPLGIWAAEFSPDGRYLATGGSDAVARVWDLDRGMEHRRMFHEAEVHAVAFSSDGAYLATASADGTAAVWAASADDALLVVEVPALDTDLVGFGATDETLLTEDAAGAVHWIDIATARDVPAGASSAVPETAEWYWRQIAGDGIACSVKFWRKRSETDSRRLVNYPIRGPVALSADCRVLATLEYLAPEGDSDEPTGTAQVTIGIPGSPVAAIWDTRSGELVARVNHGEGTVGSTEIVDMTFSPDGRLLATASRDGTARLWSVSGGTEVARLLHEDTVARVVFSPDGSLVATGSLDRSAAVWSVPSGERLAHLPSEAFVSALAFSPDGRLVATAKGNSALTGAFSVSLDDEVVRVWDAVSGRQVALLRHRNPGRPWQSYENRVLDIAFSPDGGYLASASGDRSVRLWALSDGQMLARFDHPDAVLRVAFSSDGRLLATDTASAIRVYRWRADDLIAAVCGRLDRNLSTEEWRRYLGDAPYRATCPNIGQDGTARR
jgi:WD40 repeat protein